MARVGSRMIAMAERVEAWWLPRKGRLLAAACVLMAVSAAIWLAYQFWRLLLGEAPLWPGSPVGAVDLRIVRGLMDAWFAGRAVYREFGTANYPPASHLLLWPLLGWPPASALRGYWAATTLLALAWLVSLGLRLSGADSRAERALIALLPLSMYATGATIGNGQLTIHLLPMLVASVLWAARGAGRWRDDLLAAALMLLALSKPSLAAPFFWLLLWLPGRLRPALLALAGYFGLTLWAASFQEDGLLTLVRGWLAVGTGVGAWAGSANVHLWLGAVGLSAAILPASFAMLGLLGWWLWRQRHADVRLLLGVTAIVARLWAYHNWYDDLLMLLPMLALWALAKGGANSGPARVWAGLLLAVTTAFMLAPGGLFLLPQPWKGLYIAAQVAVWLADLGLLLWAAPRSTRLLTPRGSGLAPPAPS